MIEIFKIIILLAVLVSLVLSYTHKGQPDFIHDKDSVYDNTDVPAAAKDTKTSFHLSYSNHCQYIKKLNGLNL